MKFEIPKELEGEVKRKGGWESIKKNLAEEEIKRVAKVMKALSDKNRLKILYALSHQRMCVCMIRDVIKCSYHISKLREAGLIKSVKRGNYVVYSLTKFGRSIIRHFNKYEPNGGKI